MTAPTRQYALTRDPEFRTADQSSIALFVAQLDDQTRRLAKEIHDLDAAALAWQPAPGRNTIGMLLVHVALTEVFWISVAAGDVEDRDSAESTCRAAVGMGLDDDGMPAPPDGGHPAGLVGWDRPRYVDLLDRARRHLRRVAMSWSDADLAKVVRYRDMECSREWVLYHLLEHFAAHTGQIGLVRALHRAAVSSPGIGAVTSPLSSPVSGGATTS